MDEHMPLSYIYYRKSRDEAKASLVNAISSSETPKIATISWSEYDLHIEINKGGKSLLILSLTEAGEDTLLEEKSREIVLLHRPFITLTETIICKIITDSGAVLHSQR